MKVFTKKSSLQLLGEEEESFSNFHSIFIALKTLSIKPFLYFFLAVTTNGLLWHLN